MLQSLRLLGAASLTIALGGSAGAASTDIQWWHAMSGDLGKKLEKLADDFNAAQSDYKIVPVFKGSYPETMTAAIAAFRARQQPAIVQVFEVGTETMMAAKGAVYPVYQLMKDEGVAFDPNGYLPAVTGYYTDQSGNMLSFPFNSSTPVLYYNKDAFKQAGLDPQKSPTTWPELEADGKALMTSGAKCGFTTEWPSWTMLENLSALHDVPLGTLDNGFGGIKTRLTIVNPLTVAHWTKLAEWQATKLFDYGGRQGKAGPKFYSGECAIFLGSSASRAGVMTNARFNVGVGPLPYWPNFIASPKNSIIGGASLWVLRGRPAAEYKGVAEFFAFLSKPENQAWWHQNTGYLPITQAAYDLGVQQGYYANTPGADVAIKQMTRGAPTPNSKGLRFGGFAQIRDIIEEEMETMLSGKQTAAQALENAEQRGNELLTQFEKSNS